MTGFCIWIVTPPNYSFSHAGDNVATALQSGLKSHGIAAPIVRDQKDIVGIPVIIYPQLIDSLPIAPKLPPQSIMLNLEPMSDDCSWLTSNYMERLKSHRVWDYSPFNVQELKKLGVNDATYVGMGYAPELTCFEDLEEDVDVLFIGSINQRRIDIITAIQAKGIQVDTAFNIFGAERDEAYARSKIILNMHYYEAKVFEIVRVSYLMANKRFVLSETGKDHALETPFKDCIAFGTAEELPDLCVHYLKNEAERMKIAQKGFEIFSHMTQAKYLEPVIHQLKGA